MRNGGFLLSFNIPIEGERGDFSRFSASYISSRGVSRARSVSLVTEGSAKPNHTRSLRLFHAHAIYLYFILIEYWYSPVPSCTSLRRAPLNPPRATPVNHRDGPPVPRQNINEDIPCVAVLAGSRVYFVPHCCVSLMAGGNVLLSEYTGEIRFNVSLGDADMHPSIVISFVTQDVREVLEKTPPGWRKSIVSGKERLGSFCTRNSIARCHARKLKERALFYLEQKYQTRTK